VISLFATGAMTVGILFLPVDGLLRLAIYPIVGTVIYSLVFFILGGTTRAELSQALGLLTSE
jgi:hypothetical protein